MRIRITLLGAVLLILISVLTGCSGVKEKESSIKTSNGEIVAGENIEWPVSSMGNLQKPNAKIAASVKDNATGSCSVTFSEMSKENALQYVAGLKAAGYNATVEANDADNIMFSGENASGDTVTFTYSCASSEGAISYMTAQSAATAATNSVSDSTAQIDMTDISPWPQGFLSGVPELEGKITNVMNQNNENVTVELDYVNKSDFEAYVGTLKQNGYTVDIDETKDSYGYDFRASNQNGDIVNAIMRFDYQTATVYMEKVVS